MQDEHTVAGLMRKRAELAGQIEFFQTNLRQLVIDLDNLDATLRLFVPDIDLDEIKPKPLPPRHSAFRGELSRIVLDELRRATKPATSRDIAYTVMSARSLNTADERLLKLMAKRVGACLRHQRSQGVVKSDQGPGQYMLWEIKD